MKNPYLHRELDLKDGALQRSAFHCQLCAMCIGDPPPNRKTQAAACRRFSLSKISLIDERYLSSNFARLRRVTNCIVQKYSEQAL